MILLFDCNRLTKNPLSFYQVVVAYYNLIGPNGGGGGAVVTQCGDGIWVNLSLDLMNSLCPPIESNRRECPLSLFSVSTRTGGNIRQVVHSTNTQKRSENTKSIIWN